MALSAIIFALESDRVLPDVLLDSSFKTGYAFPHRWECWLLTARSSVPLQTVLSHAMSGWLDEDAGYRDSTPFAQSGTSDKDQLHSRVSCGTAEDLFVPASQSTLFFYPCLLPSLPFRNCFTACSPVNPLHTIFISESVSRKLDTRWQ